MFWPSPSNSISLDKTSLKHYKSYQGYYCCYTFTTLLLILCGASTIGNNSQQSKGGVAPSPPSGKTLPSISPRRGFFSIHSHEKKARAKY